LIQKYKKRDSKAQVDPYRKYRVVRVRVNLLFVWGWGVWEGERMVRVRRYNYLHAHEWNEHVRSSFILYNKNNKKNLRRRTFEQILRS
jgi:hypothetical protein